MSWAIDYLLWRDFGVVLTDDGRRDPPQHDAHVRAWRERQPVVNHADIIRRVWSKRTPRQWAGPEHPDD